MKGLKDTVPVGGRDTGAVRKSVLLTSGMLGARILAATDRGSVVMMAGLMVMVAELVVHM